MNRKKNKKKEKSVQIEFELRFDHFKFFQIAKNYQKTLRETKNRNDVEIQNVQVFKN